MAIVRAESNIIGASFRVLSAAGASCLFTTSATSPASGRFNRNTVGGALTSVDVGGTITSNEGCVFGFRTTGNLSGRSTSLTQLGAAGGITVTLI